MTKSRHLTCSSKSEFNRGNIMETVITINDWWDGPLCGLAYCNGIVCIYERIFDDTKDDWSDEYYLTPITFDLQNEIMNEWNEWCAAISSGALDDYYVSHSNSNIIENSIKRSKYKRQYRKKAIFNGQFGAGFIPIDYTVEWI